MEHQNHFFLKSKNSGKQKLMLLELSTAHLKIVALRKIC